MSPDDALTLRHARHIVRDASRKPGGVCVMTGAGMSAESGIPTFRDAQSGLWSRFRPEELASVEAFRANPQRVWDWYEERRQGVLRVEPNAGHHALADFARRHPGVLRIVTQNVDNLHQRAGNTDTLRLHGDILQHQWLDTCARRPACDPAGAQPGRPPPCGTCGNRLRPGVVWFGEQLPEGAIEQAQAWVRACTLMLIVGTSGAVWPAAGLAREARRAGAWVLIVNPMSTEIDDEADGLVRGTAAEVLPRLLSPSASAGDEQPADG
jgi:NAD-dependent deacetylase